jgi:hypothetical protein
MKDDTRTNEERLDAGRAGDEGAHAPRQEMELQP